MAESTTHRFETITSPDGGLWPANTQATYENFLQDKTSYHDKSGNRQNKKGYFLKDGRAGVRVARLLTDKLPLTGETGTLMKSIHYQLDDDFAVEIGSEKDQAAMMQFGGTKEEFPHLWGDIPARPYLGISEADKVEILSIIERHLSL
jgi:phage gpG-like protein